MPQNPGRARYTRSAALRTRNGGPLPSNHACTQQKENNLALTGYIAASPRTTSERHCDRLKNLATELISHIAALPSTLLASLVAHRPVATVTLIDLLQIKQVILQYILQVTITK